MYFFEAAKQAAMYSFCYIYNAAILQKAWFRHDRPKIVPMTKSAHKEKTPDKKSVFLHKYTDTYCGKLFHFSEKSFEKVGVVFFLSLHILYRIFQKTVFFA